MDQRDRMFGILPVAELNSPFSTLCDVQLLSSSDANGSIVKYCSVVGKRRTNDTV